MRGVFEGAGSWTVDVCDSGTNLLLLDEASLTLLIGSTVAYERAKTDEVNSGLEEASSREEVRRAAMVCAIGSNWVDKYGCHDLGTPLSLNEERSSSLEREERRVSGGARE